MLVPGKWVHKWEGNGLNLFHVSHQIAIGMDSQIKAVWNKAFLCGTPKKRILCFLMTQSPELHPALPSTKKKDQEF